ncbi:MAG: hypothetical protein COV67_09865, partial [Nitrospinae bacterium CG11_big_fil_rev_8_21_14_0_20_56_8]
MTGIFSRLSGFAGLFSVLVLSACALPNTTNQSDTNTFAEPAAAEVIAVGFDNITDKYIEPVSLSRIGVDGLRGLGSIDPGLSMSEQAGDLVMYEHGQEIGRMRIPPETDVRAWAAAIVALTEKARDHSDEVRAASSEKIYEALFDGAL